MVKYYDGQGVRRSHRIPADLAPAVTSLADSEAHADSWYHREILGRGAAPPRDRVRTALLSPEMTLEQFGACWTSGELARRFPDHVALKKTANDDASRFRNYVYPVIGTEPMRRFEGRRGVELVEQVLNCLPPLGPTFSRSSRRQVIQSVHRLLTLAVYPAKVLSANPLPRGFVPKTGDEKAKAYLFPDEDAKLMACVAVPLPERLLYGILAREGMRVSELLDLTWADLDLERGMLFLDQNKTDDARSWALDPGVAEALRRWRDRFAGSARPERSVLSHRKWTVDRFGVAGRLRDYLKEAGVTRVQLFESNDKRGPLRAHDLRASFVTVNLALGKTEAWITDRTGHRSSQMIYRYKRAARTHAELNLGGFLPLHEAIPELARAA